MVGGDVIDSVGCYFCCDYDNVARESAVQLGLDAEVEVLLRAGDCRAEIVVGGADLDDGGVVAVDGDGGRGGVWRCGGRAAGQVGLFAIIHHAGTRSPVMAS